MRVRGWWRPLVVLSLGLALIVGFTAAAGAQTALRPEALEIAGALNCPVCQGESVKDSPSTLAQEMRALIEKKLEQGQTRDEIVQYFVDRYGEKILRDPPKQGFDLVLWWLPLLGLVVGVGVLAWVLNSWRARRRTAVAAVETSELDGIAEEDLARYKRQLQEDLARRW